MRTQTIKKKAESTARTNKSGSASISAKSNPMVISEIAKGSIKSCTSTRIHESVHKLISLAIKIMNTCATRIKQHVIQLLQISNSKYIGRLHVMKFYFNNHCIKSSFLKDCSLTLFSKSIFHFK